MLALLTVAALLMLFNVVNGLLVAGFVYSVCSQLMLHGRLWQH